MCYDDDARPPAPPRVTGPATGAEVLISASDGNQYLAYLASPGHPLGIAIVLLPDARGMYPFYPEMALTFARAGMVTLAIDFYGRTAGTAPRVADFDYQPHQAELRRETMLLDVEAAVGYLRAAESGPVFAVGFCMGGGTALLAGTTGLPLAGVAGFYAWTGELGRAPALPDDFAADIRCPVLGLFGDADHAIGAEVPRAMDEHMTRAGVPHEVVIYPGEPHGFFELHHMGRDGHQAAAADAWERLLGFVDRYGQAS